MAQWLETFFGVIYPWECDFNKHLSVRFYFPKFDDASYHLLHQVGMSLKGLHDRNLGTVSAMHKIQYLNEVLEGDLIRIESAVLRVGRTSIRYGQKLLRVESGDLCATQEAIDVCFDSAARASAPWPDDIRTSMETHVVALADDDRNLFDS